MPSPPTAQSVVDAYNNFRQHAANSRRLAERVRDTIDVTYQQQIHDATANYNAALASLSAVHALLDDARAQLITQQEAAHRQRHEHTTALLKSEETIRTAETYADSVLARTRLAPLYRQQLSADPPPVLPFGQGTTLADVQTLSQTFFVAFNAFEECAHTYTVHTRLVMRVGRGAQWLWKPGWIAIVLAIIYVTLFLWRDPFFKGELWGNYWAFLLFDNIGFFAILAIIWLGALSLRRFGLSLVSCFVGASLLASLALWVVAAMEAGYGYDNYSASHLGSSTANGHVYQLYGTYAKWYSEVGPVTTGETRVHLLYECDATGIICTLAASDAREGYTQMNNLTLKPASVHNNDYIVRYNGQDVMVLHNCGKYCSPTP